ncbi:MAG: SDR family NAD(P)-dependent oxidoreductase [Bacteroidetes bacterium]|jgi:2-deoxy-D-gluconate 3-dehydrogenase|nr:SDR family NAD(P)-dependent oxidoreductase [Bacteroidota bacterium]
MQTYALITGGSKGLGKAIALKFAQNKINIGITGRDSKALEETASIIRKMGVECHVFVADMSIESDINKLAEDAFSKSKHWEILVNNAGYAIKKPLLELKIEDWDYIQNVNIRSVFQLSKLMAPKMIAHKRGKIINISSLSAFYGTPGMGAYGVSKASLNQLTRTMAVEWGPFNIQTNAICPTIVMTDMGKSIWENPDNENMKHDFLGRIPMRRFGLPEDVANLAFFLAGKESDYINGQSIPLEGGKMAQP